ncbi:hypothetical protein GTK09_16465 [Jiella sp. 40Bstr34]|uniref:4-hydroxy-tetrahydrodipicolinate reductase n=2 Tax=Jiella pacifica TaxID=2696469 RepID=A0A6N9T7G2_9HYPH|nr:hypothetical protein [Jiella pacifica]
MSRLISKAVHEAAGMRLCGYLSPSGPHGPIDGASVAGELAAFALPIPVVVDFTHPSRTARLVEEAAETPCSLVIGTSGLDDGLLERIAAVACRRATLVAANFSAGIDVLRRTASEFAALRDGHWDASVLDVHFRDKADTPSGTARMLAEAWSAARTKDAPEIDIASLRLGKGVSEHRLICHGDGEVLELVHRIENRRAFIAPILAAVRFVHEAEAGLYSLEDLR